MGEKKTTPRLVHVRWIDAHCEYNKVWHNEDDVPEIIKPVEILTTGYIVSETVDYLTLAQSYNVVDGLFSGVMVVPQPLIRETKEIRLRNRPQKEEIKPKEA